ncbi:hypothetical protein [Primorskyibacter sp. 2E233]|uniref:hypothetical protein n=1 Tax=Primorskyibacter sp. 2E233 TaxID=3413431 RepID=UPI003BF3E50D
MQESVLPDALMIPWTIAGLIGVILLSLLVFALLYRFGDTEPAKPDTLKARLGMAELPDALFWMGAALRSVDDITNAQFKPFWQDVFADGSVQLL